MEEHSSSFDLYRNVNLDAVQCLGEATEDAGASIFKPWDHRRDLSRFVESDCDRELLINIPFVGGTVKLREVALLGGEGGSHPGVFRIYKNRPGMTFDDTTCIPDQEFQCFRTTDGEVWRTRVKTQNFNAITCLSIHFPEERLQGEGEKTKIYYVGLQGDFSELPDKRVVVTNHVDHADPADLECKLFQTCNEMVD